MAEVCNESTSSDSEARATEIASRPTGAGAGGRRCRVLSKFLETFSAFHHPLPAPLGWGGSSRASRQHHGMKSSFHHHLLKKCNMVNSRPEAKNPIHTPFGTGSCRDLILLVRVRHFLTGLKPRKDCAASLSSVSVVMCFLFLSSKSIRSIRFSNPACFFCRGGQWPPTSPIRPPSLPSKIGGYRSDVLPPLALFYYVSPDDDERGVDVLPARLDRTERGVV